MYSMTISACPSSAGIVSSTIDPLVARYFLASSRNSIFSTVKEFHQRSKLGFSSSHSSRILLSLKYSCCCLESVRPLTSCEERPIEYLLFLELFCILLLDPVPRAVLDVRSMASFEDVDAVAGFFFSFCCDHKLPSY